MSDAWLPDIALQWTGRNFRGARIYVMPHYQHARIGTRLVETGLAAFRQQGVKRLTVAIEQENPLGRSFYRRMGFAEVREFSRDVHGYALRLIECHRNVADGVQGSAPGARDVLSATPNPRCD